MSGASLRGAIDAKCRDCGAADAGMNWREYVATCPAIDCPLWRVRPLSRNAPGWLASRNIADLPDGWRSLPQEQALAMLRNRPANGSHVCVTGTCGAKPRSDGATCPPAGREPESAPVAVPEAGAP